METGSIDSIVNICGLLIILGLGFGMIGLRRLGWTLAILGLIAPAALVMYIELGPIAVSLFGQWWTEQPVATQTMFKLGTWVASALAATLALFGIFRLIASLFIGRNAADALVANLAADVIRGLFRSLFWWRR